MTEPGPGRACPLSYRYPGGAFRGEPLVVDTLWIAGGLYGNRLALERLLELHDAEPGSKALVFNGDFHWFDTEPEDFAFVNDVVLGLRATRGNVETELAAPAAGAGCGCAYPEWVGEPTVEHSNSIIERLRGTAARFPAALERLGTLPMTYLAQIAGERIAVVHGDDESLAGWQFSQEVLGTPAGLARAAAACDRAGVRVFASSHTCLPVLQGLADGRYIANNGAAGMPNFAGSTFGVVTRISVRRGPAALHAVRAGKLWLEALPLHYDAAAWQARFLAQWPVGSPAHLSYYERIVNGPAYVPGQAWRRDAPALAA